MGLDSLRKLGYQPKVMGMIWQQGESDADKGGEVSANYGKNLRHFIIRVREQLKTPRLIFIYGFVYPSPNHGDGITQVRQAEHDLDQNAGTPLSLKNSYVIDTQGLSLRADDRSSSYPKNIIYFGMSGTWNLAIRMADRMDREL